MSDPDELYAARKARGTEGLSLFNPPAQMPGAGQLARSEARERAKAGSEAAYRAIASLLTAYPAGLTRKELEGATALPNGTINGRVAEMRALPEDHEWRCYTEGRRDGQSIVKLARLRVGT